LFDPVCLIRAILLVLTRAALANGTLSIVGFIFATKLSPLLTSIQAVIAPRAATCRTAVSYTTKTQSTSGEPSVIGYRIDLKSLIRWVLARLPSSCAT
jgi:hypothetical protein